MTTTKTIHEDRAKSAREASRHARRELAGLEEQRTLLSVSTFEGDQEARQQLEELDAEISEKKREIGIASTTAGEAGRVASDLRRLEEDERRRSEEEGKRERYNSLADRRQNLEDAAQEVLDSLLWNLDDLAKLDGEQRIAAKAADVQGVTNRVPWKITTGAWIAGWLRDHADDLPFRPDARRNLSELDTMPHRAMDPEEKAVLQEERAEEMRARRTEEERRLDKIEWVQAVDNRRRALLAQTSHESSPPSIKKDIEVEVERQLSREFPAYEPRGISKTTGDDA